MHSITNESFYNQNTWTQKCLDPFLWIVVAYVQMLGTISTYKSCYIALIVSIPLCVFVMTYINITQCSL
jgi:hypothetical protein